MNDFLHFDKMITPTIIKIIYWIGLGVSVLIGLMVLFSGRGTFFFGLVLLVLGPLFTRVYCELLIVIFKIHETLANINNKLGQHNS